MKSKTVRQSLFTLLWLVSFKMISFGGSKNFPSFSKIPDLSMENHGSMITHLLSQVKIGMDLTKVVLPTFILETRSLLEMYADYFAHPDIFVR